MLDITDEQALDERWKSPTALYQYLTADADLLYVGISNQVADRDRAHWLNDAWRTEAAYLHCQWFPTRQLALAAESFAIDTLTPPFNVLKRVLSFPTSPFDAWFIKAAGGVLSGTNQGWARLCKGTPFLSPEACDDPWPWRKDVPIWTIRAP